MPCFALLLQLGSFGSCSLLLTLDPLHLSFLLAFAFDLVCNSKAELDLCRRLLCINAFLRLDRFKLGLELFKLFDLSEYFLAVIIVSKPLEMLK